MMFSCVFHFKLNDRFGEAISLKLFFVNVLLLSFALCRIVVWRKLTIVLCFREQDLVWFILTGAISNFPIRKLLNLPISQPLGSTVRHQHSRLAAYLLPSWFAWLCSSENQASLRVASLVSYLKEFWYECCCSVVVCAVIFVACRTLCGISSGLELVGGSKPNSK